MISRQREKKWKLHFNVYGTSSYNYLHQQFTRVDSDLWLFCISTWSSRSWNVEQSNEIKRIEYVRIDYNLLSKPSGSCQRLIYGRIQLSMSLTFYVYSLSIKEKSFFIANSWKVIFPTRVTDNLTAHSKCE